MKRFERSNFHIDLFPLRGILFLLASLWLAGSVSPLAGQYTLTVNLVGQGSVTLDPPGGSYPGGTVVTLTAEADTGHVFSGWQGGLSGYANPRNLTISANVTVTAIFTEIPAPLHPQGIWTSAAELSELPMTGPAWLSLKAEADLPAGAPNLADRNNQVDVRVLAKGLVFARSGVESYRSEVIAACMAAIGTENGGSPPTVGRGLIGYIIAADLVGLPSPQDSIFRDWLRQMLTKSLSGGTLQTIHEIDPNNRGTHCGASRAAIARYLGDAAEMARSALIFKGYLGDRNAYAGFVYGSDLSWQADPANPVGINPLGALKDGHSIDGVLPDDQRKDGPFTWPPPTASDVYEALQGALAHAVILHRAGYDAWNWQDQALRRAFEWLYNEANYPAGGDDEWEPHLVNYYYHTVFPTTTPAEPGKNVGWTDWTHGPRSMLTVNIVGAGNVALDPPPSTEHTGGGYYQNGVVVKLTAEAEPGYVFSGWSGALKGIANPDSLIINGDATVTAVFTGLPTPAFPSGIWISREETDLLPASGAAWNKLLAEANKPTGTPNLANRFDTVNVRVMAKALAFAKTGSETYRDEVINACMAAIGTENGGNTWALGTGLAAYIFGADLVGLPATQDSLFRAWLKTLLTKTLDGKTLRSANENEPNRKGTHCGASRAAIARYLNDPEELARTALVFQGWLGARNVYADFVYGSDLSWQAEPANPVGINPPGATKNGHSIDGVLPDDQREGGNFAWPPPVENNVYESLQGAIVQAVILHRAGYDVWNWEEQALRRAFEWLHHEANFPAQSDDQWLIHVVNYFYGSDFPASIPSIPGKNAGWTDWVYGKNYYLNLTINGAGNVLPDPPGNVYRNGTIVSFTPAAASGWIFAGWDGALKGYAKPDSLLFDSDHALTAIFIEEPAPLYPSGIWIGQEEVQELPMSGAAWQNLKSKADQPAGPPNISNQDDSVNVRVMAKALVYARTGIESYRNEVIDACMNAIGTEQGGRTLALGRELMAYVVAADLVGLPAAQDSIFRDWLRVVLTEQLENYTLQSTQELRPNNWGTHCGASRAAVALYLGDRDELTRTALIFKAWLGDRNAYNDFVYSSDFSWHADPANPVGINPPGATQNGHSIDGVLPDDQNRCGPFTWPPCKTNYAWEGLQGAVALAYLLHRQGYDAWNWQDQALRRALEWLHNTIFNDGQNYPASNDDEWLPHLANYFYQTAFPAPLGARPGKNAGWTDWTHGPRFNLTVNIAGAGSVQLDPPGGQYRNGTTIKLTPAAAPGYVFVGWSGGVSGFARPDSVVLDSDITVTAIFNEIPTPRFASGIWISGDEIVNLPDSGAAWLNLKAKADQPLGAPNLADRSSDADVRAMAKALVYAKTGIPAYRAEVIDACMAAIGSEAGGTGLSVGRGAIGYVIAADLVGLPAAQDSIFRIWLRSLLTQDFSGETLRSAHEKKATNTGTFCAASRAAIARYLGDAEELGRTALVFKGWLGDRSAYSGFSYSDSSWQSDPALPVGVNPLGAVKQGYSIDGVLPEDQRKSGAFTWPPPQEGEVYDGLQGAAAAALILYRAGYDVWNWENQALLRALEWLYTQANYPAASSDGWLPHLLNYYYFKNFAAPLPAGLGKNVCWTDWTHGANSLTVNARVFLEGPFQNGTMRTALRDNGLLPLQQPFHTAPWHYDGAEQASSIPAGVVDWVLVGLRTSPAGPGKAYRAAFITSDGSIVDLDGGSAVRFYGVAPGNYHIVVYHRNHLAIMSSLAHPLNNAGSLYNFASAQSQAYGTNPMAILPGGVYGMISGDGNGDGAINDADREMVWRVQNGTAWEYNKFSDFDLDGGIDSQDLNFFWKVNKGSATQMPGGSMAKPVNISSAPQGSF